jgi:hypothetical protein
LLPARRHDDQLHVLAHHSVLDGRWCALRAALGLLLLAGCSGRTLLELDYQLDAAIDPASVVRVQTIVDVDMTDGRMFFADQPFREVAPGIGSEVRDVDGSGRRVLLITHDATLGFTPSAAFSFTLLPPIDESAPKLTLRATVAGPDAPIGASDQLSGAFGPRATLAVPLHDLRCGGVACDADQTCCNGTCVNVDSDNTNCGACGNACSAPQVCSAGTCHCSGGPGCMAGETCCPGIGCVDLATDRNHCGACNKTCNPGEDCAANACNCAGGAACGVGGLCCTSAGKCSTDGVSCQCGASACSAPSLCCPGDACLNVTSDVNNCGDCGHMCPAGGTCDGQCKCGGALCDMPNSCCGQGCVDTSTDPANCGACGNACQPGEACTAGMCHCATATCTPGEICCASLTGKVCVDPSSDLNNCGGCGAACLTRESCVGGACHCGGDTGATCVGTQRCCPDPSDPTGANACFDITSDPNHCGNCTTVCPFGYGCVNKSCVVTACSPSCQNGETCVGGSCGCLVSSGPTNTLSLCADNQYCCSDGCHDLTSDNNNCGGCGKTCDNGKTCCSGNCVTLNTPANCGSCGNSCPLGCCNCRGTYSCDVAGVGCLLFCSTL